MDQAQAGAANGAGGGLTPAATKAERVAQGVLRGFKRRRATINGDPGLRQIVITIRLFPSSGNIRQMFFAMESEEVLAQDEVGAPP